MKTQAERLREARISAGFRHATDFAKAYGLSETTYRSHENGTRNIPIHTAKNYAALLGCDYMWLFDGAGTQPAEPEMEKARSLRRAAEDFVFLPVYDVSASAGNGMAVHSEHIIHHAAFRRDWLKHITDAPADKLAVINVAGDSMEPTLHHGDTVLVDMTQKYPRADGIYCITNDGELMVKRLQVDFATRTITILSDNIRYPAQSGIIPDRMQIVGRVIWYGRKV